MVRWLVIFDKDIYQWLIAAVQHAAAKRNLAILAYTVSAEFRTGYTWGKDTH
jgi:hypothetical protein